MTRRGQTGAVMPLVAVMLTIILLMAAFAVDLGMQRVARRDMQALADAVALDLARLIDGRTAAQIVSGSPSKTALASALDVSRQRNDDATLGDPPTVAVKLIALDVRGLPVLDGSGSVAQVGNSDVPDAAYVTASTAVDFAFSTGKGGASRTAVGVSESIACFRLGSFAAAVNPGNAAILNRYVNDALNLSVAGYDGLANGNVRLLGLAAELGAGSVDELASVTNVSLRRLFLASATVLAREGGEAADVTLLRNLSTSVDSSLNVDIAELMTLSSGGSSALATSFNVLDLVAASAFVANGENFLDLPVLWNVPQFSSGTTSLQVIERPQRGCGRVNQAAASTAQLRLRATPSLNMPTIAGLAGASVPVALDVNLAGADALLTEITCGGGTATSPESIKVRVNRALVSRMDLGIPIHLTGDMKASDIILRPSLFGLGTLLTSLVGLKAQVDLTINAGSSTTYPPGSTDATYAVPPHNYSDFEHVGGSGGVFLPAVVIDNSDVTGTITLNGTTLNVLNLNLANDVNLSSIFNDLVSKNIVSGINAFVDNVNSQLRPLTELLGINVAGADLLGIASPSCNSPALQG